MKTSVLGFPSTVCSICVALWCVCSPWRVMGEAAEAEGVAQIRLGNQVRRIFSDYCFQCHGPDQEQRKANLRLDRPASVFAKRGELAPVVPRDPKNSEVMRRLTASDESERMPPSNFQRRPTADQIQLIRLWIERGAIWPKHWAFVPPERNGLPAVRDLAWCRNAIDRFVLARLDRQSVRPSPEADKETLIRRVSFDLTGLPPILKDIDDFLADQSPEAYERVVDRLLDSARFGERMAWVWLDAARYADTSGYQNDGPRTMWRWRDWVIHAFNHDMPYDQFTIEQIAGDMLSNPTLDQKIATAFNRNHRGNSEGGIVPDEFQVEYVVDRVDTTATVWLGLTMGCARCHDHKYDPITQKEFYRVYAYFNNIPENGRAVKEGNSPPLIKAPTVRQSAELRELDDRIALAVQDYQGAEKRLIAELTRWQNSYLADSSADRQLDWQPSRSLLAHFRLDGDIENRLSDKTAPPRGNVENRTSSSVVEMVDGAAAFAAGRMGHSAEFDGQRYIDAGNVGSFGYFDKFTVAAWVRARGSGGTVLSKMIDEDRGAGWSLQVMDGRVRFNLVKRWLDDSIRVETSSGLASKGWHHVAVTYDGSRVAKGISIYINGQAQNVKAIHDFLNQSFAANEPLRIGGGGGPKQRFTGWIDDVRIYGDILSAAEVSALAVPQSIHQIVEIPTEQRTLGQTEKLRRYFLADHASEPIRRAYTRLAALRRRRRDVVENLPTVMVMQEMQPRRPTFVLNRGRYDQPGQLVTPGVPSVLSWPGDGGAKDRLEFARWLVDRSNPLTARVAVNRYWQMFFGTGLVKTAEDFGMQGELPSHPRLLDWLAVEYMESGWSTKRLLKLIVTSATYRQSSRVSPPLLARDPDNRLLARGPRFRLSAASIRDHALTVSGLLHEQIGGPSVRPYQPRGLWKEIASDTHYQQSHGADLYRRSLYTYWKRTVAIPNMVVLDASPREACTVRKTRTNTPLQALALMNDVTFVESSRALAQRAMIAGGDSFEESIEFAFRLATGRSPKTTEIRILGSAFDEFLTAYSKDNAAALELVGFGESQRDEGLDPCELAAYTCVCSMILNLDETLTKE